MARAQRWLRESLRLASGTQTSYQSIPNAEPDEEEVATKHPHHNERISLFEYAIFCFLGCAMLWSWNMFMACATYFQQRFSENEWILNNFQSLIIVVSTTTNLVTMLDLSKRQTMANYPFRIYTSLVLNCVLFILLALSTVTFITSAVPYLVFTLFCVFLASLSAGFSQNGVFAFVNRFGGHYTQAIMTGQGIAGVLPAIAQIVSVLAIPSGNGEGTASPKSAFVYFLTATLVSGVCLLLFMVLLHRHGLAVFGGEPTVQVVDEPPKHRDVALRTLFNKLKWLCFAIWLDFCITMVFPVFTQAILSVGTSITDNPPNRFLQPDVFIPLGFLLWNIGDLSGRVACGMQSLTVSNPKLLALASTLRIVFIPLYFMCNVKGNGAAIESDLFYWIMQLAFGFTGGWIGSCCMMAAPECIEEEEKEACGGFMGMWLVLGLASGSLMSFFVLNV